MSQPTFTLDSKSCLGILNSRQTLTPQHVGSQVMLQVVRNGTFLSKAEQEARNPGQANYFDRYIYNLKANSLEAMMRPENKALFSEALQAESTADVTKAHELFNQWLDSVQVSFNVIADRGRKLQDGDMVTCIVENADTKTGHKAIVVNNVRYKAPTAVEKIRFDVAALMA